MFSRKKVLIAIKILSNTLIRKRMILLLKRENFIRADIEEEIR